MKNRLSDVLLCSIPSEESSSPLIRDSNHPNRGPGWVVAFLLLLHFLLPYDGFVNPIGKCKYWVWLKIFHFNLSSTFLQIFASPMYEYMDTRFGIKGSALKPKNLSFRILVRGGYLTINTFVAALLPFLGDFESLTGATSTLPLTFILVHHMYLVAKKTKLSSLQKSWHWLNVCFFGCFSVASAIAALRLIAVDSKTYHLFADL